MEPRRMFAVTVAQSFPGFYEVNGDDAGNAIDITVSQADGTMTLDGVTYPDVSYVTVNGFGGNDRISVVAADGWGAIGAAANGGDGNDKIFLNIDGVVHGDAGNDLLTLGNSFYGEVYGDDGNDTIKAVADCIGAQIDGGAGDDYVDASLSNFGVTLRGGAGNDTLIGSAYDDEIYGGGGSDVMYGGGGNNTFYSTGGVVYGGTDGFNVAYVPTGTYVACYDTQFVFQW
jgi:Ca2+-binding RTX toxin-like protein